MKVDDSVESLVHCLVHSLSPGHLVKAAKGRHGIGSDRKGQPEGECGAPNAALSSGGGNPLS
jgi:hypothetical protein